MSLAAVDAPEAGPVLTKAVLRAAEILELSRTELSRILGVSVASASRLGKQRSLEPSSKEGELALLFLRAFRSLDSLLGGSEEAARAWLHAENAHLAFVPAAGMAKVEGLVRVVEYLDAMRAKA